MAGLTAKALRPLKHARESRFWRLPRRPPGMMPGMRPARHELAIVVAILATASAAASTLHSSQAAGTVSGRALFEGTVERPQPIAMAADPVCMRLGKGAASEAMLVGSDGALQNVFVYVKDGLTGRTYPPPSTAVVLDQKGCRYTPHVFGVQVGQALEIVNSDPTLHNVHALPKINAEFNFGQPVENMRSRRTFARPEVMVAIRCDVHGWMSAYAGVVTHPFFAVTKAGGSFAIAGLPPGTYVLEAWHERLGTRTQQITVDDKKGATAAFTFTPRS